MAAELEPSLRLAIDALPEQYGAASRVMGGTGIIRLVHVPRPADDDAGYGRMPNG